MIMLSKNLTPAEISAKYSTPALAFLGDAVYEQLVRRMIVLRSNKPANALHKEAVGYVCCEYQSQAVERIFDRLSDEEQAVYKRGRNHDGITPPKHSTARDYRRATGLECLFGYLYLLGRDERVEEIFGMIVA